MQFHVIINYNNLWITKENRRQKLPIICIQVNLVNRCICIHIYVNICSLLITNTSFFSTKRSAKGSCHKYSPWAASHRSFSASASNFPAELQSSRSHSPFFRCFPELCTILSLFLSPLFPGVHAAAEQSRRFSVCRFPWMKRQSQDKVAEYGGRISRLYYARSSQSRLLCIWDAESWKLEPPWESDATDNWDTKLN